jgi:hypothetical protein
VILFPVDGPDEAMIRDLARVSGVSLYDARLSLSSTRPRLFRFVDGESDARRLSSELSDARIPHYVVSEASVRSLPVARAAGLDFREGYLEARVDGAPKLSVPYAEVLLVVRGEITRERHDDKRLGTTKSVSRRLTSGLRLHLYERHASLALEVDPESFDFDVLGSDRSASMVLNFEKLLSLVSARIPDLEIDRGFDYEPVVVSRSGRSDVTDSLAESDRGPGGALYDNEEEFRFYARWRYRVARHLARASSA